MTPAPTLPWIDAARLRALATPAEAADAVEAALAAGLDPSADPARVRVDVVGGHLLLMPSAGADGVGVKVASVAPGNPGRGLPRVHAVHLALDPDTLAPVAAIDGTALTALRTPAVSAVAVRRLAAPDAAHLVVLGTGPQAHGHVVALTGERPLRRVTIVGRTPDRAGRMVAEGAWPTDVEVRVGTPTDVATADVVVCATSSSTPVLADADVPDGCCVVAIGAHEPDARELPSRLLGRAHVVVEDVDTALREAGDVVMAVADGELAVDDLQPLAAVVRGETRPRDGRPTVFKGVGMAWQDRVVAAVALRRLVP